MTHFERYSRYHLHFIGERPEWLCLLGDRRFSTILDVGAGGGQNGFHLRQSFPDAHLFSLDLSPVRCEVCRQVTNSDVLCADALAIPLKAHAVDMAVSTAVIEHVPDDEAFVLELHRVVAPGGIVVVSSVLKGKFGWYFYRNERGQFALDPTHLREYESEREFVELFAQKFSVVRVDTSRICYSPVRFLYRILFRLGLVSFPNPLAFQRTRFRSAFTKLTIPIPFYRQITLIATKKA